MGPRTRVAKKQLTPCSSERKTPRSPAAAGQFHRAEISPRSRVVNALPTEAQERIIGRTKLSDIELDESVKPTSSHSSLHELLSSTGKRSRSCATTCPSAGPHKVNLEPTSSATAKPARQERPSSDAGKHVRRATSAGNYDRSARLQSSSSPEIRYFVPSATFLEDVTEDESADAAVSATPSAVETPESIPLRNDGSLGIGSLKGEIPNE